MLYFTIISRKKLKQSCTEPDSSSMQSAEQVMETPEQYYQPAVELLNTILQKIS
ncbi:MULTISPECIES: hypothetical protein [Paenibacillus]|uniref:hypothetical protein n=1 Tax=Paenibacillus TaxID=44249 RepID=UPI000F930E62|nr:hypothetical protein [Paenibacillus odorifer]